MQNGICPLCGAAEVYRQLGGVVADSSSLEVRSYLKRGILPHVPQVQLMAFICAQCGHTALQVRPQDLEQLRDLLRGGKWTRVQPGQS